MLSKDDPRRVELLARLAAVSQLATMWTQALCGLPPIDEHAMTLDLDKMADEIGMCIQTLNVYTWEYPSGWRVDVYLNQESAGPLGPTRGDVIAHKFGEVPKTFAIEAPPGQALSYWLARTLASRPAVVPQF
jgi:hypothetical protein